MKPAPKEIARIDIPEEVVPKIRTAQLLGHRVTLEVPDAFVGHYIGSVCIRVVATAETYPDWECPCTTPPTLNPDFMGECKFCEAERPPEDAP